MQIQQSIPPQLYAADRTEEHYERPGLVIGRGMQQTIARDYSEHGRRTFAIVLEDMPGDTDRRAALEAVLQLLSGPVKPFWWRSPYLRAHRDLMCYPVGDGARTVFYLPAYASPHPTTRLFHGGSFIASSGYTTYDANEVADEVASPETSDGHHVDIGTATVAREVGVSAWGGCSIYTTFDAATSGVGINPDYYPAVTNSVGYLGGLAFLGSPTETYWLRLAWYTAAKAFISNSDSSPVAGSYSTWTVLTKTATAPGTAAYVDLQLLSTGSGTEGWVDCWALSQCQSIDQWFHPSTQTIAIDFSAAPADGDRVQAAVGSSYANTRCRLLNASVGGPLVIDGHLYPGTLRAVEDVL